MKRYRPTQPTTLKYKIIIIQDTVLSKLDFLARAGATRIPQYMLLPPMHTAATNACYAAYITNEPIFLLEYCK